MGNFLTQFLGLTSADMLVKLHPLNMLVILSEVVFQCWCFLTSSSNISKTPFLEHLCTVASISSTKSDFIATPRNSFKDCILKYKIRNLMYTNLGRKNS